MATKIDDITLTKQESTLTLSTKEKYVSDDVSFDISIVQGSVTQNAPTVNSSGLVTATTSTSAGFVSTNASADSNTLQLPTKGAETYPFTTMASATIPAGKYLTGDQTILQAYTSGIEAGNIKYGETVKVGDTANNGRIHNVAGTFTRANTVSSGYVAATSDKILAGYAAWVDGSEVLGTATGGASQTKSASPTEEEQIIEPDDGYLLSSVTVGAISPTYVGSGIERKTSANLNVSGNTVTAPAGYYASDASASVALGTVKSGSASITSLTKTYNSTSGKFDITGSANVSAPSVTTAGYVSSSEGTKSANNGGATVSATIDKIVGSTAITGTLVVTPSISKQSTPSGVTNAADGNATTTAPSSGVYIAVKATGGTNTITATPSVTTAGYGDATNHGIAGKTASVGANDSSMTYVKVKSGSASTPATTITSSPSISVDNDGLITASNSKSQSVTPSVTAGWVASGTAGTITVSGSNTSQLATQAAQTITPGTTDQTIASGKYLTGTQTIKGDADLTAANIKKGVEIFGITGTFTTTPSGKTAITAAALRSGYAGFINGSQVNGSMPNATFANTATSGKTYTDISSSGPVLVAGDYLYINEGYTPYSKISLAKLVPDGSDVKDHNEYILSGHSAYDNDGTLVAGSIPTIASTDLTVDGKTVSVPVGYYTGASGATAVSASVSDGSYSAAVTSQGVSVAPAFTPETSGTIAGISTTTQPSGTDGTDYWTITPSGQASNGTARSKATATVITGYVEAGSTTTSYKTWTITPTLNSGTASYIPKASISGSSTNASATTTVAPGTVSVSKQAVPSGVTNAASGDATTTAPSSGVYIAVKATAAANNTGATSSISGSGSATVTAAGYAPSTLTGTVSVSGTATAKTSERDSSVTYVPIITATPAFKGGAISGTATASATGASISTTTNDSGITIAAAASATRAKVQYNAAVNGWVSKAASADAYAASSATALTGTTYYLNGVTLPKSKKFSITVYTGASTQTTFVFTTDADGNTTVAES